MGCRERQHINSYCGGCATYKGIAYLGQFPLTCVCLILTASQTRLADHQPSCCLCYSPGGGSVLWCWRKELDRRVVVAFDPVKLARPFWLFSSLVLPLSLSFWWFIYLSFLGISPFLKWDSWIKIKCLCNYQAVSRPSRYCFMLLFPEPIFATASYYSQLSE